MERMVSAKNAVLAGASTLGGWLLSALGGWDAALAVLLGFMAADYLTGWIVAGVFHRSEKSESGALESRAGFKGLVRKGGILLVVFLGVLLDRAVGTGFIRPAVCLFFTANEGLSVLENLGLMGVPYPAFLRNMLGVLKSRGDQGEPDGKEGGKGW